MKCVKMCTRRSSGKWEDRNALSRNCIYIHICTYYYYKRTLHMQAMVPELLSCRRNECLRITWIQRAIPSVFMYLATKCTHWHTQKRDYKNYCLFSPDLSQTKLLQNCSIPSGTLSDKRSIISFLGQPIRQMDYHLWEMSVGWHIETDRCIHFKCIHPTHHRS